MHSSTWTSSFQRYIAASARPSRSSLSLDPPFLPGHKVLVTPGRLSCYALRRVVWQGCHRHACQVELAQRLGLVHLAPTVRVSPWVDPAVFAGRLDIVASLSLMASCHRHCAVQSGMSA